MSRLSNYDSADRVKNPATCYLEWSGSDGCFTYWDKDNQERVKVDNLQFAVIDTTKSVNGWNNATNSRIYSNQVKSVNDKFVVRESKGNTVLAEGSYSDIKSDKWNLTENIFALAEIDGMSGVVQVSLSKSALNSFIEFREKLRQAKGPREIYSQLIKIQKSDLHKNGRVEYYTPEFSTDDMDEDFSKKADEAASELVLPFVAQLKAKRDEENSETAE